MSVILCGITPNLSISLATCQNSFYKQATDYTHAQGLHVVMHTLLLFPICAIPSIFRQGLTYPPPRECMCSSNTWTPQQILKQSTARRLVNPQGALQELGQQLNLGPCRGVIGHHFVIYCDKFFPFDSTEAPPTETTPEIPLADVNGEGCAVDTHQFEDSVEARGCIRARRMVNYTETPEIHR